MTRVKICGCMRIDDAVAAAEAGADFIGVNFTQSRRRVSVEEAALIAAAAGSAARGVEQEEPPPLHAGNYSSAAEWFTHGAEALERLLARKRPLVVGVFENQPIAQINEIAEEAGLDLVQFSGGEPWSDCLLATRQAIKVVRPLAGVSAADIVRSIEPGGALAVMLDASSGTGTIGDWGVAREVAASMPLWLAGGLTPENVEGAIRQVRPWAVDVASGVETAGAKDSANIAAFIRAAKGAA